MLRVETDLPLIRIYTFRGLLHIPVYVSGGFGISEHGRGTTTTRRHIRFTPFCMYIRISGRCAYGPFSGTADSGGGHLTPELGERTPARPLPSRRRRRRSGLGEHVPVVRVGAAAPGREGGQSPRPWGEEGMPRRRTAARVLMCPPSLLTLCSDLLMCCLCVRPLALATRQHDEGVLTRQGFCSPDGFVLCCGVGGPTHMRQGFCSPDGFVHTIGRSTNAAPLPDGRFRPGGLRWQAAKKDYDRSDASER